MFSVTHEAPVRQTQEYDIEVATSGESREAAEFGSTTIPEHDG